MFQFESHGMRDMLRRYQPTPIEDSDSFKRAIPSRSDSGRHDRRLHQSQAWKDQDQYELPQLQEILQETLGVIVYQEQVMQIANRLAGYSLGEADILRRAMGKKNAKRWRSSASAL